METKYETVADIIADRDRLRQELMSGEGEWVGRKTLAVLRKDAERYRWLRSTQMWGAMNQTQDVTWRCDMPPAEVDAAIDAVMAAPTALGANDR